MAMTSFPDSPLIAATKIIFTHFQKKELFYFEAFAAEKSRSHVETSSKEIQNILNSFS